MGNDYEKLKVYFQNKIDNINEIKKQMEEILDKYTEDITILLKDLDKYNNKSYFELSKQKIYEINQQNPPNAEELRKFFLLAGDASQKLDNILAEIMNTKPELLKELFPQGKGITKKGGNQMLQNKSINIKFEVVIPESNENIKSITLTNTHERKDPNDKTMHKFFNPLPAQVEKQKMELLVGTVKKGKDKGNDIVINVNWDFTPEFLAMNPQIKKFNAFDKEVICACISEHITHIKNNDNPGYPGLYQTTLDSIYRAMVGDYGSNNSTRRILTPKKKACILHSIRKAMACHITVDLTDVCTKFGYNNGTSTILDGNILEIQILDGVVVNGKNATVLSFGNVSPLYRAAEIQNGQILTYDKKLLDVPINNSDDVIVLKGYYLRRILEIKQHNLTPTILFDTAFEDNRYTNISKDRRKQFLGYIEIFFNYWLELCELKSYSFVDINGQEIKGAKWRTVEREDTDGTTHNVSEIYRSKTRGTKLGFYAVTFTY